MDNRAAVTRSHLHPHTVVVPALILPQQIEGAGVQKVGMGIERAQHARDGAVVDGTVGVHWIGIVLLDNGKNLGEVPYGVFDVAPAGGRRFNPRPVDAAQNGRKKDDRQRSPESTFAPLHCASHAPQLDLLGCSQPPVG